MSKIFSPLTLGVGFSTLLALVPGLGIGSRDSKANAEAASTAKALVEAKRVRRTQAAEALLDQCLAERSQGGASAFRATILTLPDPQRTHMAFWFDLRLNAVQRAFTDSGFVPRAFFLPWEAKPKEEDGQGISSSYPDPSPGLIWFAQTRQATDSKSGPTTTYHALFIVGESQSLGLNRLAMREAFRLAAKVKGTAEGGPVTILGPQFSGSLASLGAALEEHFQSPAAARIRVQGTTTLSKGVAATLRATAGGVPEPRLWISEWVCNLSGASKDELLTWYGEQAGWPMIPTAAGVSPPQQMLDPTKVAIFTESNTVYRADSRGAVTQILFPMGLSRLRAERRAMEHGLAQGGAPELVLKSTLLGPAEDDALRVLDTVPQYAADTLRNTEHTLAGTILSLAGRGYTHIGISASDPEDLIFLAERIRAYHPSCTLYTTSGNHALFAHPNFSATMDGMVLFGGYPLTDAMRIGSLLKKELESSVRFTSEGEYATYYATLLALDPAKAQQPERELWGKQGFISVVKSGSIWPIRHGGLESTSGAGSNHWQHQVETPYLQGARESPDLILFVHSRLRQLSFLLLLLGGASGWIFLKRLLEVAGSLGQTPQLRPYRDLAAGALLLLATASLVGMVYLLPLVILRGSPWGNLYLWISLATWLGLVLATGRALWGRWGWWPTLLLLLLAMLPALTVGWWGRSHFLEFIPGYLRFTSPGHGVSLIPTLLLLSAGLALLMRTWFDVRRQEHAAFWPVPFGLATVPGVHLPHFRGLRPRRWMLLPVGGMLAFQLALPGGLLRPLMEVKGITTLVVGVAACLLVTALFLFLQLHRGWLELNRILEELDFSPYRAAFAEAGKLMNWNAMRALGRGLRTRRSSLRGRQILADQAAWIAPFDGNYGACLAALAREEASLPRGRKAASDFARWQFRLQVAGGLSACGDALRSVCEHQPAEAAPHRDEIHLFYALRAISFIRQGFLVARTLLIGSLGSLLLLMLAVAAFDFQPKAEVLTLLGAVLLVMAGWVTLRIIQMERHPLLCLMEGTEPDRVQLSLGLVENGLRFVLVPLLLLLATLNPSLGGMALQVFNPLMHLLK